jgi:Peptide N-acetyl-beta-D-glucosaminyl asparaginase amidase A
VYATGSGGGCEEFWYLTAPPASGYSCPADQGPYREVQVLLDGRVAGIAAPYPYVYTGGWSNPFLWYVLPAPRAFDVKPLTYDLSPYLGRLTDGQPHRVTVRVVGVPAGLPGWDTPVDFLAWRDHGRAQVTGALVADHLGDLTNRVTDAPGPGGTGHTVTTRAAHDFDAVGYLRTSHGVVTAVVHRRLGDDSVHTWGAGENPDALRATWTDGSWSVSGGRVSHADARYSIDGSIAVSPDNRLTTTITVSDAGLGYDDTYRGEASFNLGVPREQRHATGTSQERYRAGRYDRVIRTVNGFVVAA